MRHCQPRQRKLKNALSARDQALRSDFVHLGARRSKPLTPVSRDAKPDAYLKRHWTRQNDLMLGKFPTVGAFVNQLRFHDLPDVPINRLSCCDVAFARLVCILGSASSWSNENRALMGTSSAFASTIVFSKMVFSAWFRDC